LILWPLQRPGGHGVPPVQGGYIGTVYRGGPYLQRRLWSTQLWRHPRRQITFHKREIARSYTAPRKEKRSC